MDFSLEEVENNKFIKPGDECNNEICTKYSGVKRIGVQLRIQKLLYKLCFLKIRFY